ncbi:MAG: FtsB family cell division protein [Anaerolineae bacterium]
MLKQTVLTPIWWPTRWPQWQHALRAEINLARYFLFVLAICALACIYYWQASELRELQKETARLEQQAALLEQENIRLAQQAARWNSPAYVDTRMREQGYAAAEIVLRVQLPASAMPGSEDQAIRLVAQSPISSQK